MFLVLCAHYTYSYRKVDPSGPNEPLGFAET